MKSLLNFFLLIVLFCWHSTASAQVSLDGKTVFSSYQLTSNAFLSAYGNKFSIQDLENEISTFLDLSLKPVFRKNSTSEFLKIHIHFLEGLNPKEFVLQEDIYAQVPAESAQNYFYYELRFVTPSYTVVIEDQNENILFARNFGGKRLTAFYGKDMVNNLSQNEKILERKWNLERDYVYKKLESKYLIFDEFVDFLKSKSIGNASSTPTLRQPIKSAPLVQMETENLEEKNSSVEVTKGTVETVETENTLAIDTKENKSSQSDEFSNKEKNISQNTENQSIKTTNNVVAKSKTAPKENKNTESSLAINETPPSEKKELASENQPTSLEKSKDQFAKNDVDSTSNNELPVLLTESNELTENKNSAAENPVEKIANLPDRQAGNTPTNSEQPNNNNAIAVENTAKKETISPSEKKELASENQPTSLEKSKDQFAKNDVDSTSNNELPVLLTESNELAENKNTAAENPVEKIANLPDRQAGNAPTNSEQPNNNNAIAVENTAKKETISPSEKKELASENQPTSLEKSKDQFAKNDVDSTSNNELPVLLTESKELAENKNTAAENPVEKIANLPDRQAGNTPTNSEQPNNNNAIAVENTAKKETISPAENDELIPKGSDPTSENSTGELAKNEATEKIENLSSESSDQLTESNQQAGTKNTLDEALKNVTVPITENASQPTTEKLISEEENIPLPETQLPKKQTSDPLIRRQRIPNFNKPLPSEFRPSTLFAARTDKRMLGYFDVSTCSKYQYRIENSNSWFSINMIVGTDQKEDYTFSALAPEEGMNFKSSEDPSAWISVDYTLLNYKTDIGRFKNEIQKLIREAGQPDSLWSDLERAIDTIPEEEVYLLCDPQEEDFEKFIQQNSGLDLKILQQITQPEQQEKIMLYTNLLLQSKAMYWYYNGQPIKHEPKKYIRSQIDQNALRRITPSFIFEGEIFMVNQAMPYNDFWVKRGGYQAGVKIGLPIEWVLNKRTISSFSRLYLHLAYEDLRLKSQENSSAWVGVDYVNAFPTNTEFELLSTKNIQLKNQIMKAGIVLHNQLSRAFYFDIGAGVAQQFSSQLLFDAGENYLQNVELTSTTQKDAIRFDGILPYTTAGIGTTINLKKKTPCLEKIGGIHIFVNAYFMPFDMKAGTNYHLLQQDENNPNTFSDLSLTGNIPWQLFARAGVGYSF